MQGGGGDSSTRSRGDENEALTRGVVKAQLEELYLQHRPEKYDRIDEYMAMYEGKEHELLAQVKAKYCGSTGGKKAVGKDARSTHQNDENSISFMNMKVNVNNFMGSMFSSKGSESAGHTRTVKHGLPTPPSVALDNSDGGVVAQL
jgi:hypothetical protein